MPEATAEALARTMEHADETMRTILAETIQSGSDGGPVLESGRTVCGSAHDIRPPLRRFPRAVELERCPVGAAGLWHTHATAAQLRAPENSLPDIANVVFGNVDAHAVVGTQSGEIVIAAEFQEAMAEAFQNALGLDVASSSDVVHALKTGQVPNPPGARERVRRHLGPLIRRYATGYPKLDREAAHTTSSATVTAGHTHGSGLACAASAGTLPDAGKMREQSRELAAGFANLDKRLGVSDEAVSSAVGLTVGNIVSGILGL